MIYLFTAIVCCTLFSVLMKFCQQRSVDVPQVILFGYIAAAIICFLLATFEVGVTNAPQLFSVFSSRTIWLAIAQGAIYMIGFAITDRAVWRCGVTLNNFATRSSLIIPILLCWALLNEHKPSWIALALVFIALLLIILPNRQQQHAPSLKQSASDKIRNRKSMLSLIGVFTFAGLGDFMIKVMQKSAATDGVSATNIFDPHYLVLLSIVFGSGAMASLIYCLITKHIPLKFDPFKAPLTIRITYGFLLGVSNVGCTASIVLALTQVSTSIFYAIYNIGIVLVSTIIGITIFKEHVNIFQALGIVIGITAILFMVWL